MDTKKTSGEFTIAYTIFNKAFLIEKIINGISELGDISVLFLFDGCTDGSVAEFLKYKYRLKNVRAFVNEGRDLYEVKANNFLLRQCATEYCVLIQDDMVLKNRSFINLAESIYCSDSGAGLVGFKDGYEMAEADEYKKMISSPWSQSKLADSKLSAGEFRLRTFVNRGPLCVPQRVVKAIGYLDESFYPIYWDDNDYCLRSKMAGFSNYVAYGEIESEDSWGATRNGSTISNLHDIYQINRYHFAKKWKIPDHRSRRTAVFRSWIRTRIPMIVRRSLSVLGNHNGIKEITNELKGAGLENLNQFRKNITSQAGEDGIVEFLCQRLDIASGWCVEFGAWDGEYLSNTFRLHDQSNWYAILIEGDSARFETLKEKFGHRKNVYVINAFVSSNPDDPQSLDSLLADTPIPENFALLSIDVDGNDWYIWKNLKNYTPSMVIVEANSTISPDRWMVGDIDSGKGSSVKALVELGKEKGYELVAHTGNCIFVHKTLYPKVGLKNNDLAKLFDDRFLIASKKNNKLTKYKLLSRLVSFFNRKFKGRGR